MKVIRTLVVLDRGNIIDSEEWGRIHSAYTDAIRTMVHPPGSKNFTIRQKTRKLNRAGKPTSRDIACRIFSLRARAGFRPVDYNFPRKYFLMKIT
jgi:hypothetical protein